jgi:hypothetical protein
MSHFPRRLIAQLLVAADQRDVKHPRAGVQLGVMALACAAGSRSVGE